MNTPPLRSPREVYAYIDQTLSKFEAASTALFSGRVSASGDLFDEAARMAKPLATVAAAKGIDPTPLNLLIASRLPVYQAPAMTVLQALQAMALAMDEPATLDLPAGHVGSAPAWSPRRLEGAWFSKATRGGLNADMLRKAGEDGRLKNSKKPDGRWLHDPSEVMARWPEYADRIKAEIARMKPDETG